MDAALAEGLYDRAEFQDGVGDGVAHRVAVRVPMRAHGTTGKIDAAEDAAAAGHEFVAIEAEADAIADGSDAFVPAVMEHIELAGVHSGDSACSLPPYTLSASIQDRMREQMTKLGQALNVVGPAAFGYDYPFQPLPGGIIGKPLA